MSEIRTAIVLTTVGSRDEGERIASVLVEERLAACVNAMPVRSTYRWQGVVERAEEVLLVVKTRRGLVSRVVERIRALHSYQLPEVVAVPIIAGSRQYLAWVGVETAGAVRRPGGATRRARPRAGGRHRSRVPA